MAISSEVIKFNLTRMFTYPVETAAIFFRKIIELLVLILFWYSLSKYSDAQLNTRSLISYFLIAGGIAELVIGNRMKFGRNIQKMIASGQISIYLMRPIKIIPYLYSTHIGTFGIQFLMAPFYILAGLFIQHPSSLISVVYFIVFLALAACIAFCMNILTAIIAFYVGEAGNFENVINHVVSILSGSLVPISFFPDSIREIVIRSPFPSMIFVPAQSLKFTTFDASVSQSLFTALFWAVSLSITTAFLWNYSIKKYEAYGI